MTFKPKSGKISTISSSTKGRGPAFIAPIDVIIYQQDYYVVDPGLGAIVRVDPNTGDRVEIFPVFGLKANKASSPRSMTISWSFLPCDIPKGATKTGCA